ncbi:MAG: TonB-dependent receptor [Candidatus Nitronauta litoralis]|uniref:TonB-dependent receptor n=1 Tax=Candidatus Nitronauta litoralis TaxID=2705533 RepID=A0A7T0BXG8_9BACT|nr:MAG: TonB-dependent receptor [Candidatus Nitronauta litoralis]
MKGSDMNRPERRRVAKYAGGAALLSMALGIMANSALAEDKSKKQMYLNEVAVIGSKEAVKDVAGSAYFVDTKEIRTQNQTDINRVLRKVPGVYVREEDGFGLFPNISLRGVDPGRSQKVTIMEDGILTAPAPYSAPGAYYSPNVARMESVEVLKGSTTVRYGPYITGGVINFNSTAIPDAEEYYSKSSFGSFNEIRNHTYFGNTIETSIGNIGFMAENYHRNNTGFRTPQITKNNLTPQSDTGLTQSEQTFKLMWEPKSSMYQRFEVKLGHTDMQFNDGYLGQTQAQFRMDPFNRFDGARFDQMNQESFRTYLRHMIEFSPDTKLVTTGYGNHFTRHWFKLNNCRNVSGGVGNLSLGQCVANTNGANLLSGSPGVSGALRIRNNDRDYYLYGVQAVLDHHLTLGPTDHQMQFGVRYHSDQIRRWQSREQLTINTNADITARATTAPGSQGNQLQNTDALAVHLEDKIEWGRFTFTPGIRFEYIDQEFTSLGVPGALPPSMYSDIGLWGGGGSLNYNIIDDSRHRADVFGSVIRGFSPPGPSATIETSATDFKVLPERSTGAEIGTRYHNNELAFETELIYFRTDFSNLIVTGNVAAGAGNSQNLGSVLSEGIEFQVRHDPGQHRGWSFNNPWYFSLTYTDATVTSSNAITTAPSDGNAIFAAAFNGAEVPYVPEIQFALGTGIEYGPFGIYLDTQYVDETFASGNNSPLEIDPATGTPDARFGMTDSFFLVDLTVNYQAHKNVRLFTNFKNITDDHYIATRVPHGARPGAPFSMLGGVEITIF